MAVSGSSSGRSLSIHLAPGDDGISRRGGPLYRYSHLPRGPAPSVYSYDLVGSGFCRTIHISYDPADPDCNYGTFRDLPPGEYRLLENGAERARVFVCLAAPAAEIQPDHTWPIAPAR